MSLPVQVYRWGVGVFLACINVQIPIIWVFKWLIQLFNCRVLTILLYWSSGRIEAVNKIRNFLLHKISRLWIKMFLFLLANIWQIFSSKNIKRRLPKLKESAYLYKSLSSCRNVLRSWSVGKVFLVLQWKLIKKKVIITSDS